MNERCFAMRRGNVCGVLSVKGCPGYVRCPFYKPRWMFERDRDRLNVKLRSLPEGRQQDIADKYHSGNKPWKGTCE